MSQVEWDLVSKKRWANNKYSVTDVVSFIVTILCALLVVNIAMDNYTALSYFGIPVENAGRAGVFLTVLGLLNFMSGLNVLEDFFNTLMRLASFGAVILLLGGNFNNLQVDVNTKFNNNNPTMRYNANVANIDKPSVATIVPTKPSRSSCVWHNTKQNRVLKGEEALWCKNVVENKLEGREHCKCK